MNLLFDSIMLAVFMLSAVFCLHLSKGVAIKNSVKSNKHTALVVNA